MTNNFDFILVPCPGVPQMQKSGEYMYIEEDQYGYIGSDDRMLAAAELMGNADALFLVGGSCEKVTLMKKIIEKHVSKYGLANKAKMIRIVSAPDSLGNLRAWKRYMDENKIVCKSKKMGIVTNFYHMPRILRQATDMFSEITITPLIAESIISKKIPGCYIENEKLFKRIHNELNGLKDWEAGNYKDQNKTDEKEWIYLPNDKLIQSDGSWDVVNGFGS